MRTIWKKKNYYDERISGSINRYNLITTNIKILQEYFLVNKNDKYFIKNKYHKNTNMELVLHDLTLYHSYLCNWSFSKVHSHLRFGIAYIL